MLQHRFSDNLPYSKKRKNKTKQWTPCRSPSPALLLHTPKLKCAISHSNVKQLLRRRMYDPPWHLSSFLSQMCKHYYPWVILSGVVKIRSLSCLLLATHTIKTRQAVGTERGWVCMCGGCERQSEAVVESDGNGADVCVAADLWPDKGCYTGSWN